MKGARRSRPSRATVPPSGRRMRGLSATGGEIHRRGWRGCVRPRERPPVCVVMAACQAARRGRPWVGRGSGRSRAFLGVPFVPWTVNGTRARLWGRRASFHGVRELREHRRGPWGRGLPWGALHGLVVVHGLGSLGACPLRSRTRRRTSRILFLPLGTATALRGLAPGSYPPLISLSIACLRIVSGNTDTHMCLRVLGERGERSRGLIPAGRPRAAGRKGTRLGGRTTPRSER